ncbi:MAG: 30S ribosome-binding factor RbfA [Candidatus Pacebacteria bacterium]|nr:30S ribosome-binding factor RbfA [Candidatus Paceibacterota bacterium]
MEQQRLEKFTEVLREELAKVISQEIDFPKGVLATVMNVSIYSDLSWAEIFVSVIPEQESEFVMNVLNSHAYFLHQALNDKIRIRRIPRIKFFPYIGPSKQEKLEQILEEIKENSAT